MDAATDKRAFASLPAVPGPFRVTGQVRGSSSLASGFVAQMQGLMKQLHGSSKLYIRCVKPNATLAAFTFEEELVRAQLSYLGVMETVRIRRAGFPVRMPFGEVYATYKELACRTLPPEASPRAVRRFRPRESAPPCRRPRARATTGS